ncbi:hypothetical protein Ddc_06960 [Ditylenchus destructor]|nr:hypothetical protein Ddc_06960 [Ditylenchus destructor]
MTCVEFDSSMVSQLAGNELSPIKSEPFLHEQQNQQDAYAELNGNIVALMNGQTSTAFGAYLERICGPRRIESVTETNEQDESTTNDDENGNFDAPDDELWNDKLALECINQNSQSNSDDDDYRYKSFNAVRDQNNKKIFKLGTIEGHIITFSSWTRLKEKLCEYHYPIDQVILQDVELNSKAMDFFRSVDPILFTKDMCFNLIDLSKARAPSAEIAFIELFRNHFNPKWIQFEGLKGISSEIFASATIDHSLLNCANTIKFLDTTKDADPFVLDNDFILRFLHSDKHTSPRKRLIIHHKFLGRNTLKGIWNMLLQKFASDSIPSNPFVFSIQCERVFEPLFKRCEYNAKTKEELIISDTSFRKISNVETAMRYDHTPNGFKVSIVRRAHCRRLRDRKYLRNVQPPRPPLDMLVGVMPPFFARTIDTVAVSTTSNLRCAIQAENNNDNNITYSHIERRKVCDNCRLNPIREWKLSRRKGNLQKHWRT